MFETSTSLRVRYAETDQMGVVYYGNYAAYLEVGRVEALRALGLSYAAMEASGIMLPVLELKSKFIRPARYDDLITIQVRIPELPATRIRFEYELFNEAGTLLHLAETTLVFIDMARQKPCMAPEALLAVMRPYYQTSAQPAQP